MADVVITEAKLSRALTHRFLRAVDSEIMRRAIETEMARRTVKAAASKTPAKVNPVAARMILRMAQLHSVGNWIQQQADTALEKLEANLVATVKQGARSTTEQILAKGAKQIATAFDVLKSKVVDYFRQITETISDRTLAHLVDTHGGEPSHPDVSKLMAVPILGATLSEHFDKIAADTLFRFKAAVRSGVQAGDSADQIVSRIAGSGDAVEARKFSCYETVHAGDVAGHEFHGNQWVDGQTGAKFSRDELAAHSERLEEKMEKLNSLSMFNENSENPDEEKEKRYQRKYDALHSIQNVVKNNLVALKNPDKGEGSAFHYQTNSQGDITAAVHAQLKGDSMHLHWAGSVEKGAGEKLIRQAMDRASNSGATKMTGSAKFGSMGYYEKRYSAKATDEAEPIMGNQPFEAPLKPVKASGFIRAGLAEDALAEAAKKALQVNVRLMDTTENSINKVIQAAITLFSNEADFAAADEMPEEARAVMGWLWVAVLDERTCEECEFYDGNTWDAEFEPVGEAPEFPDQPPLHFNCRCALVPVNLEDGEPDEAEFPKNFDDYLAQFSKDEQEQAFGKLALRQYQQGGISAAQLIAQQDHALSLEDFIAGDAGPIGASSRRGLDVVRADSVGHPFRGNQHTGGIPGEGQVVDKKGRVLGPKTVAQREKWKANVKRWKASRAASLAAKPPEEQRRIAEEKKEQARLKRAARAAKENADAAALQPVQQPAAAAPAAVAWKPAIPAPARAPAPDKPQVVPMVKAPETPEGESEKVLKHAMSTSHDTTTKKLGGGINASYKATVTYQDENGEKKAFYGVWKPSEGEYFRGNMDRNTPCRAREVAVYRTAQAMGIENMPAVVETTIDSKQGSLMAWAKGEVGHSMDEEGKGWERRATKLAMLDIAVGNSDRHPGNYLMDEKNHTIIPIDNGLSFPDRTPRFAGQLTAEGTRLIGGNRSQFVRYSIKNQTDESVRVARETANKMDTPEFKKQFDQITRDAGMNDTARANAAARMNYMIKRIQGARDPDQMKYAFGRIYAHSWGKMV